MCARTLFSFCLIIVLDLIVSKKSDDEKYFLSPKEMTWDDSEAVRCSFNIKKYL